MWTIPVSDRPDSANPDHFEDQYHRVKDDRDATKKALNDCEDDNRRLRTRCSHLEQVVKKSAASTTPPPVHLMDSFGSPKAFNKLQLDYEDLFRCYELQQREHRALIGKHKSCLDALRKQKREVKSLRLRCGARLNNSTNCRSKKPTGGCIKKVDAIEAEVQVDEPAGDNEKENVENAVHSPLPDPIIKTLQLRLNSAEAQLQALKLTTLHVAGEDTSHEPASQELTTKLHLLQAQHELDEARIQAQSDKVQKILRLHEEYKARHEACKKELHLYQDEVEALQHQVDDAGEAREELQTQNQFLEEKVRQLCATLPAKGGGHAEKGRLQQENEHLTEENHELRENNARLTSQLQAMEEHTSKRLGEVWQQLDQSRALCNQREDELKVVRQSLADQTDMTQKLSQELNSTLSSQQKQIDEISLTESQRLQKIRQLESQQAAPSPNLPTSSELSTTLPCMAEGHNELDVTLHSAALTSALPNDAKSFALIDFHTYGSELSDIVPGATPAFNLTVSYELGAEHRLTCEDSVRVEIYLVHNEAAPELFAHASVAASALANASAATHFPALALITAKGSKVGSLSLSLRLARPVSSLPKTIAAESSSGRMAVPDAIAITIKTVTLLPGKLTSGNASYYVHYRFLSFCDVLTSLERPDAQGVVAFQHKSSFPVLSSDDGSLQQVLSSIAKSTLYLTLYRSSDRSERQRFRAVGEAAIPLNDIGGRANVSADIVSLEARLVGKIDVAFDASI